MGWYEAIKDGIAVAQQADNIPLVEKLIDAQKQIFDLVDENHRLRDQIRQMEETSEIASTIERHDDAYITLADDPDKRIYCSCCWDTKGCLCRDKKPELELIPAPLVDHLHSMIELLMTNIRKKLSKVWAISIHQYGQENPFNYHGSS